MAIAFRSVGTRTKVDVSATGTPVSVAMPAGHVSGDCLLMFVVTDDQRTESVATAGWNLLTRVSAGTPTFSIPWPSLGIYWKVDNGSEPATVSLTVNTTAWPVGNPYVLAFIAAYSGTHATTPMAEYSVIGSQATALSFDHPQLTTTDANDWLLTVRAVSANTVLTFTTSSGTDVERVDDTDGFGELSVALYDSAAALSAGLQPQRTTTTSDLDTYGTVLGSIALRPPNASTVIASAGKATAAMKAYNATVQTTEQGWDACGVGMPVNTVQVDWAGDGSFASPGDTITGDLLSGGIRSAYGRDQARQLSPSAVVGTMSLSVINVNNVYSPDNASSPLAGNLDPARRAVWFAIFNGVTYPIFSGRIDDYTLNADYDNRTVDFSFLDGLSLLNGLSVTTPLYQSIRTGDAVNALLDAAGWTGPRDIDYGATFIPWWWVDNGDALAALQDLVRSEGPPAIAYQAPDGTMTFRDRHHRIRRSRSIVSQGVFSASDMDCGSPAATGLTFTPPFTYTNGWRDIINSVTFSVEERQASGDLAVIWQSSDTVVMALGDTLIIDISASDPFYGAVAPVAGTDYTAAGTGVVTATLLQSSGQSTRLVLTAAGGGVTITGLQVRAYPVTVQRTTRVSASDPSSIQSHGQKTYPNTVPWAGANDAQAIANLIVSRYAQRIPTVALRLASKDPAHWVNIVSRGLSDRITINNAEIGLADDFFVEKVDHQLDRLGGTKPPVHSVVLTCERQTTPPSSTPFTFDLKGAGFDNGTFDPISADRPDRVWVWDDPVQSQFGSGYFAT